MQSRTENVGTVCHMSCLLRYVGVYLYTRLCLVSTYVTRGITNPGGGLRRLPGRRFDRVLQDGLTKCLLTATFVTGDSAEEERNQWTVAGSRANR